MGKYISQALSDIKQYYSLFAEQVKVAKEFAYTNSITSCFAGVSRTNTLLGGAKRFAAFLSLLHAVDMLMEIEYQMRTVRDYQTILQMLQSLGLVLVYLIEQRG